MSKYQDTNGVLYLLQLLKSKFDAKVDKETGKGLSANDYTTAEKNKLAAIEAQANKTTVNNTLTSDSTTDALSAAQGKELKRQVDEAVAAIEDAFDIMMEMDDIIDLSSYEKGKELLKKYEVEL